MSYSKDYERLKELTDKVILRFPPNMIFNIIYPYPQELKRSLKALRDIDRAYPGGSRAFFEENMLIRDPNDNRVEPSSSMKAFAEAMTELDKYITPIFIRLLYYEKEIRQVKGRIEREYGIEINSDLFWDYIIDNYSHLEINEVLNQAPIILIQEYAANKKEEYEKCNGGTGLNLQTKIIDDIIVDKLFIKYGKQFPNESPESWRRRFMVDNTIYEPKLTIKRDTRGYQENNRLLIYAILKEIEDFLISYNKSYEHFNQWVANRFGFDYRSAKHRYKTNDKIHSETSAIKDILKLKKDFDEK